MANWYVYHLRCPIDDNVFYVGKGSGERMFQHEKDARAGKVLNEAKTNKILSILKAGLSVDAYEVARFFSEQDAYDFESEQINSMPSLTNIAKNKQAAKKTAPDTLYLVLSDILHNRGGYKSLKKRLSVFEGCGGDHYKLFAAFESLLESKTWGIKNA